MAKKLSETYSVAEAGFDRDSEAILSLWEQFDEDAPGLEKLDWLYRSNPEGSGAAFGLWYLPTSRLAGIMCFSSRAMRFGQERLAGSLVADLIIEREHRSLGPYRMISEQAVKLAVEKFDLLFSFPVVTAPTPNLGEICERDVDYLDAVMPLSLQPYLERRLPAFLARLAAGILEPARRIRIGMAKRRVAKRYAEKTVDEAFVDALWDRVADQPRLQGGRSSEFVFWRLAQPPFVGHRLLGIADRDGQPAAFVVYEFGEDASLRVIDLCWFDLDAARAMLVCLVHRAVDAGAISISVKVAACYEHFLAMINGLGFHERRKRALRLIAGPKYTQFANSNDIWIQPLDNDYI